MKYLSTLYCADNPVPPKKPDVKDPTKNEDKPLQEALNRHMIEPLKLIGAFQKRFVTFLSGLYSTGIPQEITNKIHTSALSINDQLNSVITAMKEYNPQKTSKVLNNLFRKIKQSKHIAAVSPEHIQEVKSWRDALVTIWTKTLSARQYIPPERYDRLKASLTRLFELTDNLGILLQSVK
ncbi:MAG: hypothetical protein WC511_02280 [Candidatus Pacearchaeota archaeon]